MKRLHLILIGTALVLTAACTDTDAVLPFQPAPEISIAQISNESDDSKCKDCPLTHLEITVDKAPNEVATFTGSTTDNETKQAYHRTYAELLPASFLDCGTFIRLRDGSLLEVLNASDIPASYRETGSQVRVGYVAHDDLPTPCQVGTAIDIKEISFIKVGNVGNVPSKKTASDRN
jgi:hypothetical protein